MSTESPTEFSRLLTRIAAKSGSVVNFDDVAGITLHYPELRLQPAQYYHYGPFCVFAKFHNRNTHCRANKTRSKAIAAARRAPFWGCCPYGVWDLAFPALLGERLLGVFYLGSFQGEEPLKPVEGVTYAGPALPPVSEEKRLELLRHGQLLADWLLLHVEDGEFSTKPRGTGSDAFFERAVTQYIASHFQEPVNLGDFARTLGLHPNYLGHRIRQATGSSFSELLGRYRLERAGMLLRASQYSITEIAFQCGFQDSAYFSVCFSKMHGKSPRAFRKT